MEKMKMNKNYLYFIKYKNTYRKINNIPKKLNELFSYEEIMAMEIEKIEGNKLYINKY